MWLLDIFTNTTESWDKKTTGGFFEGIGGTLEKLDSSLKGLVDGIKNLFAPKLDMLKTDIEIKHNINAFKEELVKNKEYVWNVEQLAMIQAYKGNDKEAFGNKVIEICDRLGINPNWLMAVMRKESRLNPKAINKNGWASWLIQFMPKTAKWLWTSVDAIRTMSSIQQLDYVEKYLKTYASKIHSYEDTYQAVFYPAYLWKPSDKKLPANVIAQNPWIWTTVWEFTKHYAYRDIPKEDRDKIA